MIKQFLLACIILLSLSNQIQSQNWKNELPNKNPKDLSLFDYKEAFDKYWSPYNVQDGYYFENGIKKKAPGWKQFLRWYHYMENQINPEEGSFPLKSAQDIYQEYSQSSIKETQTANWTSLGPTESDGGYAGVGRINCIAFHPTNNDTYWVGAASGGVWMTSNNGSSWTNLTDDIGVLGISDILIPTDYATSQTIYIATGDRDGWDTRSIGVMKSTDGGNTWNTTGIQFQLSDNKMVSRLLLDPNNNQIIIAATTNGVYKTTNGGTTWNTLLSGNDFVDMEYKPGDFNTLYGATRYGDIYVSSNGGTSWSQSFNNGSRIELAVTLDNSNYVYALVAASDGGLYGVYRSTNSGASFSQVYSGSTSNLMGWDFDGGDNGGQGWYDISIAASPTDANLVLVGGVNTWKSTNGGNNWTLANHWYGGGGAPDVHADKHQLKFRNNGDLFECNDGGVYISSDNGFSWSDKTNGMAISQIYKLAVAQFAPNEILNGLQDNGTKLLSNSNWSDVLGGDGMECLIDYTNTNTQYGSLYYGIIRRTTNHWNTYTTITPSSAGDGAWVTPYIMDPTNTSIIYAGYSDVWKTTNKGDSWTKISNINTSGKLRSMAIAPSNTDVLFVADLDQIWKTTNNGGSWTEVTNNLPVGTSYINSIAIKASDPNTIWVSLSGYNNNNVYKSTNGGTSWSNISTGLPAIPANSIVQNIAVLSTDHLYLATELGVYFKDGDADWVEYNTGLPNVKCSELEISYTVAPEDRKLRLATFGRGLWESDLMAENTNLPSVATLPPTSITVNSATLGGLVSNEGTSSISERGVVYSTNPNPTTDDNKIPDTGNGTGSYSIPVSGLQSATTYYTKAYAINNSGTAYGGQETFATECNSFNLPYSEDFEGAEFPPNCWTSYSGANGLGSVNDWEITSDAQSGNSAAYVQYEDVNGGLAEDWLVSPAITLSTSSSLSFYQKQTYGTDFGSTYAILVSSSSQSDIGSFSVVESWTETSFTTNYSEKIVDLSAYDGQEIYLAFMMSNDDGDDWFIDNINVTGTSNPTPVATVSATPGCSTGAITVFSSLSGTQTFYLTDNSGTELEEITADATSYEFSGQSNGSYRGKVQRNGQMSDLSEPVSLANLTVPNQPSEITGETSPCSGDTETYSVINDPEATSYSWSLPSGWSGNSTTNSITVSIGSSGGSISVTPSNVCGEGISRELSVSTSTEPDQPSPIAGETNPCEGSTQTYSVTNDPEASSYIWSLPGGWTGNSNSSSINVIVGTTNGSISVTPSNNCGEGTIRTKTVTVGNLPDQPSSISGENNPCEGSTQTYSVSNDPSVNSYSWTLPSGWSGTSSTNSIIVTVGSSNGNISVIPTNDCGDGPTQALSVMVQNLPDQPSTISGEFNPCEGDTETYSIINDPEISSYSWSLPSGWTGSSTSNSITVTVGSSSGNISVTPSNDCGEGLSMSQLVNVSSIPSQPDAISGNTEVCEGTQETYSVNTDENVDNYEWTIPAGWTGSSSSNSIVVTVGANDGIISVTPDNSCGIGTSQSLNVVVSNSGPSQPDPIEGEFIVCEGSTQIYSVPNDVAVQDYDWTIPAGWSGNSSTNVITLIAGANGGEISVIPSNLCGTGPAQTANIEVINNVPDQPGAINGPEEVCQNSTQTYSVSAVVGVSYNWLLPSGWSGNSTTNEITVSVGGSSGNIIVIPSNDCGDGPSSELNVQVNSIPDQPGTINGENEPCVESEEVYSVDLQEGAVYNWAFPSDWTGNSSGNSISLTVGSQSGEISVSATNQCGESTTSVLTVNPVEIPGNLGSITGLNQVIENSTESYSVTPSANASTYEWLVENIWEIIGNDEGNQVEVYFPEQSESGTLSVKAINQCGESLWSELYITILPLGVDENTNFQVEVYPNPTRNMVHIKWPQLYERTTLEILNQHGQIMFSKQIKPENNLIQLDVSEYAAGSYFIHLKTNQIDRQYKMVITK